jgi:1-acyl-sn-glycerol-3-phosphate acyltransferase
MTPRCLAAAVGSNLDLVEMSTASSSSAPPQPHDERPRAAARERPIGVALDPNDSLSRGMLVLGDLMARYHRHHVIGLERLGALLEERRRVILVGNHVLDVVDPFLFAQAVYKRYGVVPIAMGHRAWFTTPVLKEIIARYGVIPSRDPDAAARAITDGGLVMLFPGAVREAAMRDFEREPYRLKWEGRSGFLRLALEHDAEIVFFGAVGSEQMYYQSRLAVPYPLIRLLYQEAPERYRGLRLSFGMLGPHLLPGVAPFPTRITHVLSEPLDLGDRARALADADAFAELHTRVTAACQAVLDRAVAEYGEPSGAVDRGVRRTHDLLRRLGL